jgi:cell division FtsZ-interacting protein ZapD
MPVELGPEALHQEMNLLKNLLKSEGDGAAENETLIIGEALKAPSRYHQYLLKAADISEELLSVREELLTDGGTMSLQQLGALAQDFSRQYDSFRNQLTPSEQKFQSAMLIETAVKSLNEAIDYWRTSNHFRRWGHGNYTDKIDDTQILQLKLQTANTAIGNLSGIVKTRQIFSRSFDTDSN